MKNATLSLLLTVLVLLSMLSGSASGYFDPANPHGVRLPITILANDSDLPPAGSGPETENTDQMPADDILLPEETPEPELPEPSDETMPEEDPESADQTAEADSLNHETKPEADLTEEEDPMPDGSSQGSDTDDLKEDETSEAEPGEEIKEPALETGNQLLEEVYPDFLAALDLEEDQFTEYSEEERAEAEELLRTADEEIFLRKGYTWDFSEAQGYVNEILEPEIIHQYYVYHGTGNDILMSMFPAAEALRAGNKRLDLTKGLDDEFHITYSLKRTENLPAGAGGRCWMQYDNSVQKGSMSESGVILFPGYKAYAYQTSAGYRTYQAIADLSSLDQDELLTFDFIRMDGVCRFYANGEFLFSWEDDIVGYVSFEGGSEIFKGGNRVHCEFDDFAMTYR